MYTFHAMNTEVGVIASGDEEAIARRVAATFAEAERRFSRFRDDSELCALNRARGPTVVSPALFEVLTRARRYVEVTEGIFDPAIGQALRELGYDRSFAPGRLDRARAPRAARPASFAEVRLDAKTRTVERPEHVQLDLGGIVKGRTVDAAAHELRGPGVVDAGGDAIARGPSPTGAAWQIEIEDPRDATRTIATLALADGAVATSAPNRRRWRVGAELAHHLIDPRTGAPADTDLLQATVIAASAEQADVFAKTAFILGARDGRAFLERHRGVGGVLVPTHGRPIFVGALEVREVARA